MQICRGVSPGFDGTWRLYMGQSGSVLSCYYHRLDNRLLCKIAGYLLNEFGARFVTDSETSVPVEQRMVLRCVRKNPLLDILRCEVLEEREYGVYDETCLADFPRLTEFDLLVLFAGSYQYNRARNGCADLVGGCPVPALSYYKLGRDLVSIKVPSFTGPASGYQCVIQYTPIRRGVMLCKDTSVVAWVGGDLWGAVPIYRS
ncbi:uncharacterized protein LOC143211123 [Lasioglossum baleicum]|uniref:uncharacterized protein LOC143211123 n=1 Tax=Lasioglossum baleicum TaxID=434251 RepID=UPI003FCE5796